MNQQQVNAVADAVAESVRIAGSADIHDILRVLGIDSQENCEAVRARLYEIRHTLPFFVERPKAARLG